MYLGDTLILDTAVAPPPVPDPWTFFSGRATDYAVEFTAGTGTDNNGNRFLYFDTGRGEGTLLRAHPAAMFSDSTIQRLGRFWHAEPPSLQFVATHRRGGGVAWNVFLPTLGNNGSVYIINVTDEEYFVFDSSDSVDGGGFTRPASSSNNFVNWQQNDVVDHMIATDPVGLDSNVWLDGLADKQMIFALSTQDDYRPYA